MEQLQYTFVNDWLKDIALSTKFPFLKIDFLFTTMKSLGLYLMLQCTLYNSIVAALLTNTKSIYSESGSPENSVQETVITEEPYDEYITSTYVGNAYPSMEIISTKSDTLMDPVRVYSTTIKYTSSKKATDTTTKLATSYGTIAMTNITNTRLTAATTSRSILFTSAATTTAVTTIGPVTASPTTIASPTTDTTTIFPTSTNPTTTSTYSRTTYFPEYTARFTSTPSYNPTTTFLKTTITTESTESTIVNLYTPLIGDATCPIDCFTDKKGNCICGNVTVLNSQDKISVQIHSIIFVLILMVLRSIG